MCACAQQAEEFQEVVTIMREFLPEAEAQLKFRSLPDDEVAIMQMIEKHEVLTAAPLFLQFFSFVLVEPQKVIFCIKIPFFSVLPPFCCPADQSPPLQ